MSKLTLAVALALAASSALAAPSDLQRQMAFARLHQGPLALPGAPSATVSPVTADEVKGRTFTDTQGSTLRVAANGSWEAESPTFRGLWHMTALAGPSFELGSAMDRQTATFKLSDALVRKINADDRDARPLGAFVSRLSASEQAELATRLGAGWRFCLAVVYGSLADGQVLLLLAK